MKTITLCFLLLLTCSLRGQEDIETATMPEYYPGLTFSWRNWDQTWGEKSTMRDWINGQTFTNTSGTKATNGVRGLRFASSGRYTGADLTNTTPYTVWIAYYPRAASGSFASLLSGANNGFYNFSAGFRWYSASSPATAPTLNAINTSLVVVSNTSTAYLWTNGAYAGTITPPNSGALSDTDVGNNQYANPLNGDICEIDYWSLSSAMSTDAASRLHSYALRRYSPQFYINPLQLSNTKALWVGDDAQVDGSGNVTNWVDQVTGWALQNTDGTPHYPVKTNNVWNGHATVSGNGTDQHLWNTNFSIATGGNEVMAVASFNSTVWNTSSNAVSVHGKYLYGNYPIGLNTNGYDGLVIQTSSRFFVVNNMTEYGSGSPVDSDYTLSTAFENKWHVLDMMNASTTHGYTNNVELTGSTSVGSTSAWYGFRLFRGHLYGAADFGPFSVAELIVFQPALTEDQRAGVYNYLTNKYRITIP